MTKSKKTQSIEEVVVHYAPLVKRIAHHLVARLPASVQSDDLIQAGMIGLLEAAKHYDASKGASFETYAGIRIRGSMLDEMRRADWVPRSVHRNARRVAEAVRELEHRTGHEVRDIDVARALEISLEEYHKMMQDSAGGHVLGYDDLGLTDDMMREGMSAHIAEPYECLHNQSFKESITKNIAQLPERERLVIALYYDEELNLREIGEVLGVTESRVCQIHGQAMLRLQARLHDWVA